jgi:hypothetical protein
MSTSAIIDVAARLAAVKSRIREAEQRFHRPAGSVELLAVSKRQPIAAIRLAAEHGQRAFGENYLQEAIDKRDALANLDLEWHFVGALQSNKTRPAAESFDWVHAVDRLKIAQRLNEQRPVELPPLQCCIQVNVSAEASKAGVHPDALPALAHAVAELPQLKLRGLMTLPEAVDDFAQQREAFRLLHECQSQLIEQGLDLDTLSMGMTNDLEAAVAEGTTIVRIGTAVFGPRPEK